MPYEIAGSYFATKEDIRAFGRKILASPGTVVSADNASFLIEVFQYHEQWLDKSASGVEAVVVDDAFEQPTRCFFLRRFDGKLVDISFPHSVKCIPSTRVARKQPQWLTDYKSAARRTISPQIDAYRHENMRPGLTCPITGQVLTRTNCHVDHVAPLYFDELLWQFTVENGINPALVQVGSNGGTVPYFVDETLANSWGQFHQKTAQLRLLSSQGNLSVRRPRRDWAI